MEIISLESGPVDTFGYIVYDNISKDAVIIDTPLESTERFTAYINKLALKVKAILLTHSHWDHTADAPKLKKEINSPIYIHKNDEHRIIDPDKHKLWPLPFTLQPFHPDRYFEDNQNLTFGSLDFKIIHTPGHTEGGVCLYSEKDNIVFTGDTLFNMSVGRVDLPGGDWDVLLNSIKLKLMTLPEQTDVFCGHGNQTTIGFEMKNNPFLTDNNIY